MKNFLYLILVTATISASAAKQLDRSPVYPSVWHRPDTAIIYPNLCDSDMFLPILMRENGAADTRVAGTYNYHTDHLGSAHWITKGYDAVQFIHYMPYGEMWYNQQGSAYNERFKYTGKERDSETGYDFFGARSYMSDGPLWLSPDPLMDKYPHISPYAYCDWNPVKYTDPDGREKKIFLSKNESYAAQNFRDDKGIYIFGHGSPGPNGYIANDRGVDGLPTKIKADHLAGIINNSDQYKNDGVEGNASMVFLYACHAGEGESNAAQQLSAILNDHETLVVGPIGNLESTYYPGRPKEGQYNRVTNSRTGREGEWGVYKNGQLQTTIRGNRTPNEATVKCQMFFDNMLKSIKNFFKNENE